MFENVAKPNPPKELKRESNFLKKFESPSKKAEKIDFEPKHNPNASFEQIEYSDVD